MTKMPEDSVTVNSDKAFAALISELTHRYYAERNLIVTIENGNVRTDQQRKAIEVFCRMLADALNGAGFDMVTFPWKEGAEVPWTQASVKERLWKPLQLAMLGKESTTEADRTEYNKVYEVLCKTISERTGVTVPAWPQKNG